MSSEINWAIVLLSYNHPDLTARALHSFKDAGVPVYLIHNGSSSENRQRLMREFPDIEHRILPENRGYSGGANFGLELGFLKHEWLVFFTNDCVWSGAPKFTRDPAVIVPEILLGQKSKVDSIGGVFHPHSGSLRHMRGKEDWESQYRMQGWRLYCPGSAFAVHRALWSAVGGFEEHLGTYWEDVDWSVRLQSSGFPIVLQPEWKVRHGGGSGGGKTCRKDSHYTIYLYHRNRKRVSWRYARGLGRARLGCRLLFSWMRVAGRLTWNRRFSDLLLLGRAVLE